MDERGQQADPDFFARVEQALADQTAEHGPEWRSGMIRQAVEKARASGPFGAVGPTTIWGLPRPDTGKPEDQNRNDVWLLLAVACPVIALLVGLWLSLD